MKTQFAKLAMKRHRRAGHGYAHQQVSPTGPAEWRTRHRHQRPIRRQGNGGKKSAKESMPPPPKVPIPSHEGFPHLLQAPQGPRFQVVFSNRIMELHVASLQFNPASASPTRLSVRFKSIGMGLVVLPWMHSGKHPTFQMQKSFGCFSVPPCSALFFSACPLSPVDWVP